MNGLVVVIELDHQCLGRLWFNGWHNCSGNRDILFSCHSRVWVGCICVLDLFHCCYHFFSPKVSYEGQGADVTRVCILQVGLDCDDPLGT
jgi:hypothetical protein